MPANTYGRQVVEALVNKSGGSVAAGDVVIIDTANDGAFTTTTTARVEVTVGVAQEAIASNATGRVLLSGFAALVNVPASVTRGHYVETHTVAKQATGSSTRRSGSMGQFRTGGTTPTAVLWGQTDQTASGGGSVTGQEAFVTGSDITMTSSNTFYDGPSLSLVAGTYFLIGNLNFKMTTTGASFTAKLWDGTTVLHAVDIRIETNTVGGSATVFGYVVVGSTTTWKVSGACNTSGQTILRTAAFNGTTDKATKLVAIKIA